LELRANRSEGTDNEDGHVTPPTPMFAGMSLVTINLVILCCRKADLTA